MPPKTEPKAKAKGKAKVVKKEEAEDEGVPKVPQPDKDAYDAKMQKFDDQISKIKEKQAVFQEKIKEQSGGKDEFYTQKKALQDQVWEFDYQIKGLNWEKDAIKQKMGDKKQEAFAAKQELNKMKKSLAFNSEREIDDRLTQLEVRMRTETMSLKEEKDLLKEISDLKKRRPQIAKVKEREESLAVVDVGASYKDQLSDVQEKLNQYWEGKKKVLDELKQLQTGRKDQVGDLPQLIEQRDALSEQIKAIIQERNLLRDEFRTEERAFQQHLREVREKRQAKAFEERKARDLEWNKQKLIRAAEKLDEQPYVTEMTLIEQTMAFCKSLVATKEDANKEEKKEDIQHNNPDGTEILARKEDREEEFYFVPTAKKKSKSKNKGGKSEGSSGKAIKHNAATFKLFDELKLEAPITTDDIPATLEKLDEQLETYKSKVKEWEEKREEMKRKILEDGVMPGQEEAATEEAAVAGEGEAEAPPANE